MPTIPLARIRWLALFLFVALPACRKEDAAPVQSIPGQNVLLVTMDTIRADRIGCYGHRAAKTPALDAIAARGAKFDDALTQVPLTLPSHCTMMTGRLPREFGVRVNNQAALGTTHPTLASIFKQKGYKTAAFVSAFVLDSRFGLDRGFDVYDDQMGNVSIQTEPLHWERPAQAVTDRALTWLNGAGKDPFFCWVHYFDPHGPYTPPAPYPPDYDGEIAYMDSQIKRLDDWLSKSGMNKNTLLLVVGDHGESFGEHGEDGHGIFLYETSMRVPLLLAHPTLIPAPLRIEKTVGVVDVFPTLLDVLNLPGPQGLLSHSFASLLRGEPTESRDVYGESEYVWQSHGWAQQRSLTNANWKFISSKIPELYDRRTDPAEKVNLYESRADVRVELSNKLFQFYESQIPSAPQPVAPSAAASAALATLGYTGGSAKSADEFLTSDADDPKSLLSVIKDYKVARDLLEAGKSDDAVRILRTVAAQSPKSPSLVGALGVALVAAQKYQEALTVLDQAIRLDPTHQPALFASGDANFKLNRFEPAAQFFLAAVGNDPNDPTAHFMLGKSLSALQKPAEARTEFEKAIELVPEFPAAHQELAIILAESKDFDGAVAHFRAALRADPGNDQGWYSLGMAQVSIGRHQDASASFAESVRINPQNGQAWINLGISLLRSGKAAEGKQALQKATAIPATAGSAWYNLAITASRENDRQSAERYLKNVLEVAPTHPTAAWDLARDYLKADRIEDAVQILRRACDSNPQNVRTLNLLASILATTSEDSLRDGAEALRLAQSAADLTQSRNPFVLKTLAEAQAETGDFAAAIKTVRLALQDSSPDKHADLRTELTHAQNSFEEQRPVRRRSFY